MSKKAKLLVVVSDLHCGSDVGLSYPDATIGQGNTVGFGENYAQEWLWDCWRDAIAQVSKIAGKDKFVLLCNGDLIEGIHHGSAEVIAAAMDDHIEIAIECIRPLSSMAQHLLVTLGTECHTKGFEHILADKLGAVGGKAKNKWHFSINGTQCEATHHIGATSRSYLEASLLSIALGNARLQSFRAGHIPSRVFVRAHRHAGGWYSDGDCLIAVTGGWQHLTRHGFKCVPDAIPRPSVVVLDWRDKPEGALPAVHNIQFAPPEPAVLAL
jgi:hypothetical protein